MNVISTFAGTGGSSLGYKMAGLKILLACEIDNNAVLNYRQNFPETPIFHGDIADLNAKVVEELTGIKPGELDVFDGSPPCQGFSTIGKREFGDNRNFLYLQYIRMIDDMHPKCFKVDVWVKTIRDSIHINMAICDMG